MIAALFIERGGVYWDLPNVDAWDESRDARLYRGPHPVVTHPPCQRFGRYWSGGPSAKVRRTLGDDDGCFASALESLLRYGGVLEHPAFTNAWEAHGLTRPPRDLIAGTDVDWTGWLRTGICEWTCEVWQSAYGHPARKRTWLYYVGERSPSDMEWLREAGTHQVGWFDRVKPTLSKKEASRTPPAFRDALIALARTSRAESRAA